MGTMTYDEFSTELGLLLENRNDAQATDADRISRWINQAYTYMCHPSIHYFREMQTIGTITLASGDNDYDISTINSATPVAIRWITYIHASSFTPTARRQKLKPRDIRWFESKTLSTGRPFNYTIDGTSLFIAGVPGSGEDGNLLRVGFVQEPDAIATGETTVLNTYYDRPLMKFVQAFAEADLGDKARALITLKEAAGLINNARERTELEAEDTGFEAEFVLHSPMGF